MNIYCFAGPNGSGKSTTIDKYTAYNSLRDMPFINADLLAKSKFSHIQNADERNLAAAKYAEYKREEMLENKEDFMFETVLSTRRNLDFLVKAKQQDVTIRTVYVLTRDKEINVERVQKRVQEGGHPVPEDKIRSRYDKCMQLLPELVDVSDTVTIYDNTQDQITSIMLRKDDNIATVFSNNPNNDEFLTQTIIKPLEEKYGYELKYISPLTEDFEKINIYDQNNLKDYVDQVENDLLQNKTNIKNIEVEEELDLEYIPQNSDDN